MRLPGSWTYTFYRTRRLARAGHQDEARALARRFSDRHPDYEVATLWYGRHLSREAATELFESVLKRHPEWANVETELLCFAMHFGSQVEAARGAEALIDRRPDLPHGYVVRFALLVQDMRWEAARETIPLIEERLNDSAVLREEYADALLRIPEKRKRAIGILRKLAKEYPRSVRVHHLLGLGLEDRNPRKSVAALQRAEQLSTADIEVYRSAVEILRSRIRDYSAPPAAGASRQSRY